MQWIGEPHRLHLKWSPPVLIDLEYWFYHSQENVRSSRVRQEQVDAGILFFRTSGTIQPGNSIGTLTVTSPVTFNAGSSYNVELDAAGNSNLINIIGAGVTFNTGATLNVLPQPGMYGSNTVYTIIQTTGGISGQFSTVNNPLPLFQSRVDYLGSKVELILTLLPFQSLVGRKGNVADIARCFDNFASAPGTDVDNIITQLLFIHDENLVEGILLQMQPSIFKGFALSQENMSIRMRSAFTKRADMLHQNACLRNALQCVPASEKPTNTNKPSNAKWAKPQPQPPCPSRGWTLWFDAIGDISRQRDQSHEKGFKTFSGGAVIGSDYQIFDGFYVGASGAYSYVNIDWNQDAAAGNIQSIYASLYSTYACSNFFINAEFTGGHNSYFGKRHIEFLAVDRQARHTHSGSEATAYLSAGGLFQFGNYSLIPFASADYVYLHQNGFKEHGANSLSLRVHNSNSNYLRGELGLNFNGCLTRKHAKWIPNAKFGVIREWRFMGKHYTAKLTGADCTFDVTGLNPDRVLFAPGVSLTTLLCHDRLGVLVSYDGEFGKHFWDQNINLQLDYSF